MEGVQRSFSLLTSPRLDKHFNTSKLNLSSKVYGSDPTTANTLREGPFLATSRVNGQLFPPQSGTNIVTGDDRADLFAGMTAFHVVFMRYHNRFGILKQIHVQN